MTIDLSAVVLTHGSHEYTDGTCAREALHLFVCGVKKDATPPGLSHHIGCLPILNDMGWRDDAHRTAVLAPYIERLARCKIDPAKERAIAQSLTTLALRVFAPDALDLAADECAKIESLATHAETLRTHAETLRTQPSAAAARAAARAADARAAAYAAYVIAYERTWQVNHLADMLRKEAT